MLWHQPPGQERLELTGPEARAARQNVGGFSWTALVNVFFRGPGQPPVVTRQYPDTNEPIGHH